MANINNKNKVKKLMKKMAGLSLCAVLVGGVATGVSVNGTKGYGSVQVSAADKEKIELLKKDSKEVEETEEVKDAKERTKGNLDVSDIVEEAMPSVVSITNKSVQEVEDYYGRLFGFYGYAPSEEREVEASGSGVIIGKNDTELLLMTNAHVIDDADTLTVGFIDGSAAEAKVKGYNDIKDIAVIAVSLDDLDDETLDAIKIAKIGDSDTLRVGEQVVVIGNALGYGQSVTTGIVSAKNRYIDDASGVVEEYEDQEGVNLIQTDAAINPGNSGGALLNMDGEVVGINQAKMVQTSVEGMCYAIAISDVDDIIENLMNTETRDRLEEDAHGMIGIMGRTVDSTTAEAFNMPKGVFVVEVTEDGAADEAGMKTGCIITEFDGKAVSSIEQLVEMLEYYAPGEEVDVVVKVADGGDYTEETVTITLKEQDKKDKEDKEDKEDSDEEDADEVDKDADDEKEDDGRIGLYRDWEDEIMEEFFGEN